jgi:iron(III) transport system substrate-binding protein
MADRRLHIYSGRNRPDLTPVYELYRQLTGVDVRVEKVYHQDVGRRVVGERHDPQADLLLTNSQLAVEAIRPADVFDPYPAPVAERYPTWLRAPDFAWLSFAAWPRVAMINRRVLPTTATWPRRLEDFTEPRFRGALGCASLVEMTTVAQFAALQVCRGDSWTRDFIDSVVANGLRIYESNKDTREALVREGLAAAIANSSNVHVFYLEGQAVGEAWLDQSGSELGTHVEGHTVAVLRGCRQPEEARLFVDFLLSVEAQEFLARRYGETPVNPEARVGLVRPLDQIRRLDAALDAVLKRIPDTLELLRSAGFEMAPTWTRGTGRRRRMGGRRS